MLPCLFLITFNHHVVTKGLPGPQYPSCVQTPRGGGRLWTLLCLLPDPRSDLQLWIAARLVAASSWSWTGLWHPQTPLGWLRVWRKPGYCLACEQLCFTLILCCIKQGTSYPDSIHMWLACTHPMKSCCPCSGRSPSTPLPHSHIHNASVHVWSKPWVQLWWCSRRCCCRSVQQFYCIKKKKERERQEVLVRQVIRDKQTILVCLKVLQAQPWSLSPPIQLMLSWCIVVNQHQQIGGHATK